MIQKLRFVMPKLEHTLVWLADFILQSIVCRTVKLIFRLADQKPPEDEEKSSPSPVDSAEEALPKMEVSSSFSGACSFHSACPVCHQRCTDCFIVATSHC